MHLEWTQRDPSCWIGLNGSLRFPSVIDYLPEYGLYVVDGCQMSYKTLTAAKIAAARTAQSRDVA